MNGVLGMTEWLMETQLTPEQRDCAEAIRTSGDTLLSIISNILDFSKIESGKLQLQQIDFDVKKLLEDIVSPFRQRAQLKGVALACQIQEQVPLWLHGDPDRLCQIVSNLLGNAIKFTEHGEIVLRAEVDERQDPIDPDRPVASRPVNGNTRRLVTVRFSVADTGIGIAPEACTRIFQPFMQADGSTTKKYGGTGLGLAICQQLVDLMGGSIGVDSEPGQGSVFHVTVPLEHKAE